MGTAGVPSAGSLGFLPLVGIVVGQIAGWLGYGVSLVAPHALAVAVAFAAMVALTGAIHIDGFLDSSDALFATVEPKRRLEIMKDPSHGTYAVAAFAAVLSIWLAALWSLPPILFAGALAFAAGTARWAMILNVPLVPYARSGEFGEAMKGHGFAPGAIAWALVFCATGYFLSPALVAVVALAAASALGIGRWARDRLGGGLTGDVYGFGIVVLEAAALALTAAVQASTWAPRI